MDLERVISQTVDLPPAAKIFPQLLKTLRDPTSQLHDVIELLKVDVNLSANILRIASGSYYANSTPTNSLDAAIQRIGLSEINRLVSIAISKGVLDQALSSYNMQQGALIEDSLATAQIMHALSHTFDPSSIDTYYTTGLLHAIGKIVINQYLKKHNMTLYGANDPVTAKPHEITIKFERQILGFDHAQAGAALIQRWGFEPRVSQAIQFQHQPAATTASPSRLTSCLHFSNRIAPAFRTSDHCPSVDDWPQLCNTVALSHEQVQACLERAYQEFSKAMLMLKN
jgi:HD-like signal output (HDOD) protein